MRPERRVMQMRVRAGPARLPIFANDGVRRSVHQGDNNMHLLWTILIGFVAGIVAKLLTPGAGPSGFFLTAALGVVGSLAATYLGQLTGLYSVGQSAGFIGAVVGAALLLVAYHFVAKK